MPKRAVSRERTLRRTSVKDWLVGRKCIPDNYNRFTYFSSSKIPNKKIYLEKSHTNFMKEKLK
jgi:hypothetical protein